MASAGEAAILQRAVNDDGLLVTLDEDFGDWAVLPLSHHPGVIRLEVNPTTTANFLAVLGPFLERAADRDFRDHLVIVKPTGARWIYTGGRAV